MAKANEIRAFDVTNDEGNDRYGIVVLLGHESEPKPWAAVSLSSKYFRLQLEWFSTPKEAVDYIVAEEEQERGKA